MPYEFLVACLAVALIIAFILAVCLAGSTGTADDEKLRTKHYRESIKKLQKRLMAHQLDLAAAQREGGNLCLDIQAIIDNEPKVSGEDEDDGTEEED